MSIEENKELARRFHSCTLDGYRELMSESFIGHDHLGHSWDRASQIAGLEADISAFAGLQDTIHDIVAEGDRVAVRFARSGVFNSSYEDEHSAFEPTYSEVFFPVMELLRISDGKIMEGWFYNDDGQTEKTLLGKKA